MSNRTKHMAGVAEYMYEHAGDYNLDKEEMFVLGLLHDVGYIRASGDKHEEVGAAILEEKIGVTNPHILWCIKNHNDEVKHFSWSIDRHRKAFLLIKADMSVNAKGELVGYDKRLEDIGSRYGKDSETYRKCKDIIRWLKSIERK